MTSIPSSSVDEEVRTVEVVIVVVIVAVAVARVQTPVIASVVRIVTAYNGGDGSGQCCRETRIIRLDRV